MANKKKKSGNNNTKAANKAKSAKHANDLSSQEFEAQLRAASGKKKLKPVVQVQEKEIDETVNGRREKALKEENTSEVFFEFARLFVTLGGHGRPIAARTVGGPALIITYDLVPTPSNPYRLVPTFHDTIADDANVPELFPLMVHVGQGLMYPEDLPGRKKEVQGWTDWDTLLHEARVGCDVLWYEWVHAYTTPFEPPFVVCEGWRAQRILDSCAFEDEELDRFFSAGDNDEEDDNDMVDGEPVDEDGASDDDDDDDDDSSPLSDLSDAGSEWSDIVDKIDNDMLERMLATARAAGKHKVSIAGATPLPPPEPLLPTRDPPTAPGTMYSDGVSHVPQDWRYARTDIADDDTEMQMRERIRRLKGQPQSIPRVHPPNIVEGRQCTREATDFSGLDENKKANRREEMMAEAIASHFSFGDDFGPFAHDPRQSIPRAVAMDRNESIRVGGAGRLWHVEQHQEQGRILGEVEEAEDGEWEDVESDGEREWRRV